MSRSLSSEYVEMQSNGCQTELNEIVPQLNSPNSIEIDNTEDSKKVTNGEACENFHVIPEIIIDSKSKSNFSSFYLSIPRESNNENDTFYKNIPSATMIFNMATRNETQITKQSIINENEHVNDQNINENIKASDQNSSFIEQNKKKCPNFNICQGKGNIILNRKNHCVLDNCPKKMNIIV